MGPGQRIWKYWGLSDADWEAEGAFGRGMEILGTNSDQRVVPTIRCPHCKNKLLHKSNGHLLVRSAGPICVDEEGACTAKCHFCKGDVALPLELSKAAKPGKDLRFVITEP